MTSEIDVILDLLAAKSKVRALVGTFVAATTTGCTVDVGDGRVPARFGSSYLPEVNEPVNVWFIDDDLVFVMGPTVAKPATGTVVSTASGLATLSTDFGQVVCPYIGSAPTSGQVMAIRWHGGPVALGVLSAVIPAATPPDAPDASPVQHVDTFQAIDAGSWRGSGWQQQQVRADDAYLGAWFYGSKVADTVPAEAVVTRVELFLSIASLNGADPNFALHTSPEKPPVQPTFDAQQSVAASPGWLLLPTEWGDALKEGGAAAGVGVNHGGRNVFQSLAEDGMSGALRITSTY